MNLRRSFAGVQRLLVTVVLLLSGAYLLIYLYRWEWNRAIISGIFFIAAEIALATSLLARRIDRLDQPQQRDTAGSTDVLRHLRATPVTQPHPFAWLTRASSRGPSVFVPVLLGAGAILSALAYVVERIAQATAQPAVDHHLARRLAAIAPPPGGLRGPSPSPAARPRRREPLHVLTAVVALAAIVVVGWLGASALVEATQTRPDPADRPARTTIELVLAQRGTNDGALEAAEGVWVGCRALLGSLPTDVQLIDVGGDHVAIVLEPGIGRLGVRRLTGCLTDVRVNLVLVDVVDVRHDD